MHHKGAETAESSKGLMCTSKEGMVEAAAGLDLVRGKNQISTQLKQYRCKHINTHTHANSSYCTLTLQHPCNSSCPVERVPWCSFSSTITPKKLIWSCSSHKCAHKSVRFLCFLAWCLWIHHKIKPPTLRLSWTAVWGSLVFIFFCTFISSQAAHELYPARVI